MRRLLKWVGITAGVLGALFSVLLVLAVNGVVGPAPVPIELVHGSVEQDTALLDRAFALPVAALYGRNLHWQSNGSLCGPASLVNAFRSLGDDASDEGDVLAGSGKCRIGLCFAGLTLDELAEVARLNPARTVSVLRDLSPDAFLQNLRLSNDPDRRVLINFSRKPIFGSGGGHHSPIGGYLEAEDLVLVLDVNEHYQPWLVSRASLYAAMDTLDGDKKRGLLVIE
jgi:hypothetical protein